MLKGKKVVLGVTGGIAAYKAAEFVRLLEEVRLKDRQQVAKALDRIEQDRVRDRTQIGTGLQYVAALTAKATPALQH